MSIKDLFSRSKFLGAALLIAGSLQASVSVNFVSTGPDNVLPYTITLNDILTSAICYDNFDGVPNPPWQANLLTLTQAATTGFFSADADAFDDYQEIGWLSEQTYPDLTHRLALQYDIWNIFDEGAFPPAPPDPDIVAAMNDYQAAYDAAQAGGFTGFDFSQLVFIEQVGAKAGDPNTDQAFVALIGGLPPGLIVAVPEPSTGLLMAAGLLTAFLLLKRRNVGRA